MHRRICRVSPCMLWVQTGCTGHGFVAASTFIGSCIIACGIPLRSTWDGCIVWCHPSCIVKQRVLFTCACPFRNMCMVAPSVGCTPLTGFRSGLRA